MVRSVFEKWWPLWRKGNRLAAPVMVEQVLRTLMRTTDILVSGALSPAAIAAVGLGDVYARVLVRAGLGLGSGAIALSSQDTGSGAVHNRNEAVTQAILLGIAVGLPFVLFGLLFSSWAIAVLGAEEDVVLLGAQYLAVIMIAAPAIHVSFIGARAIQGVGDTTTPMYINGFANGVNILLTVGLAFGVGPFPELGIVGIAMATAVGEFMAASMFITVIHSPRNELRFVHPTDWTITKQLVSISVPRFAEGVSGLLVELPFNAVLLVFGTNVNAGYHIGRRMYQQVVAPLSRGYGVAANILVGQALGQDEADTAYSNGIGMTALAVMTIGTLGFLLYALAGTVVPVFTNDPLTITYATGFAQAYALAAVFIAAYKLFSGSLRGGSETRAPFIATLTGMTVFLLGVSYVGGISLAYGVGAAYVAIILDWVWRAGFTGVVFRRRNWISHGQGMMAERESLPIDIDTGS